MTLSDAIFLASLVLPILASVGQVIVAHVKSHIPADRQAGIRELVGAAVQGVEQVSQGRLAGVDKKTKVLGILSAALKSRHINVDPTVLDTLIESAVFVMNATTPTASTSSPVLGQPVVLDTTGVSPEPVL